MTGLGAAVRLIVRRDRLILAVWAALFIAMVASAYATATSTYSDGAALAGAARAANANPSLLALFGPVYSPSVGSVGMIKMVVFMAAALALLTGLIVIRNTRADEESGRREMLGAVAIGRLAPPSAALLEGIALSVVVGAGASCVLIAQGAQSRGALVFGAMWALIGTGFAAFALLCAQVTEGARAAQGLFVGGLGLAYVLRSAGDLATSSADGTPATEPGWESWLSPLGWAQQMRPFADDRWWPAVPLLALTAILAVAALRIAAGRDLGAGLVPVGLGRDHAGRFLGSVEALTWRLHRGQLTGWLVGSVAVGLVFGGMGSAVASLADNPGTREILQRLGGSGSDLVAVFLGAEFSIMGLAITALGISIVNTAPAEETSGRAAYLLSGPVSRIRWYVSHLVVGLVGTAATAAALGAGASLTAGRELVLPAVAALPAVWAVTAVAALAGAIDAHWSFVGWVALALCLVATVADVLRFPRWASDLSPFTHVHTQPGQALTTAVGIGLLIGALAVMAIAASAQSRRDLA